MENVRLQKLFPVIRDQDFKVEGLLRIMEGEQSRYEHKMAQSAKAAQDKGTHIRSLKHDFSTSIHLEPAPGSIFNDIVASLQDEKMGHILHRLPTETAMQMGRKARTSNVQRIIDILV